MTMRRTIGISVLTLAVATPVAAGQQAAVAAAIEARALATRDAEQAIAVARVARTVVDSDAIARALAAADGARAGRAIATGFDAQDRALEEAQRALEDQDRAREAQDRERERLEREREAKERELERRDRDIERYDRAQELLDDGKWEQAAQRFAQVAQIKGPRADAALYWQAYALNRQGQRPESLQVIAELIKGFPSSRYIAQAKALDAEVRRTAGQPVTPEAEADEDLKLMAIQALQNSDPERAVPMLDGLLKGNASPKLKSRALFVLA